jgi:hypothetical protein
MINCNRSPWDPDPFRAIQKISKIYYYSLSSSSSFWRFHFPRCRFPFSMIIIWWSLPWFGCHLFWNFCFYQNFVVFPFSMRIDARNWILVPNARKEGNYSIDLSRSSLMSPMLRYVSACYVNSSLSNERKSSS